MAFEDLLKSITEAEKRSQFNEIATQLPGLKKYYEMGEQAETALPHINEIRELTKNPSFDFTKTAKLSADYLKWKRDNWDDEAGMTRNEKLAKDQTIELQNRIAELETQVGVEMTAEEIKALTDALLKERGVLTREELKTMIPMDRLVSKDGKPLVATIADVDGYVNNVTSRFQDVYAELTPEMIAHHERFKEPIDMKKVFTTMETYFKENGKMMNPKDAYRATYSEQFKKLTDDQIAADKKAEYEKGLLEGRKAAQQEQGGRGMPISGRQGSAVGSVMKRVLARMKTPDGNIPDAPLGKGDLARAAADKYMERGESTAA